MTDALFRALCIRANLRFVLAPTWVRVWLCAENPFTLVVWLIVAGANLIETERWASLY